MESFRNCPYCSKKLTERPYWRHIEHDHPNEYNTDRDTWIRLFNDYVNLGMPPLTSLIVISEIFNKDIDTIKSYLKKNGIDIELS